MSATGQAAGNGGEGQAATGGEAAPQGFDAAALQAQLQSTAGGVDDLRQQFSQFLESAPWQPQEQQQEAPDPGIDLSFLDQQLYGDPAVGDAERQQFSQELTGQFDQRYDARIQQAIQQATAPLQEQLAEQRREQAARDLVAEFPEFQDVEKAKALLDQARTVAEQNGVPELAHQPWFWRTLHMASRAAEAANAETKGGDGSPQAAHLEGSGGSGPAGGQQVDIAGQIIGARKGASVLPFG